MTSRYEHWKINADYEGDASRIKAFARNTIIVDDSKITRVSTIYARWAPRLKVMPYPSRAKLITTQ